MKNRNRTKILVCHGAWCQGRHLYEWLSAKGTDQEFEIVAPDLYGHGDRSRRERLNGVSLDRYVEEMQRHLKNLGPSHLVGHSLGGLIMQKVAELEHGLALSLTLLGSTPPKGIKVPLNWRFLKPRYLTALALGRSFEVGPAEKEHFFPDLPPGVTLCRESGRVCREVLRGYPVKSLFPIPVFVYAGEYDPFFPPHVQYAIAEYHQGPTILGAQMTVYECGHMFHFSPVRDRIRTDILFAIRVANCLG